MKRLLIILILLAAGLIGGYVWFSQQQPADTAEISADINTLQGSVSQQFSVLSSRAQELGGHAQNVLGSSVQVDEKSEQSLQQKAVEYGQYLYCKQVVETYEKEKESTN